MLLVTQKAYALSAFSTKHKEALLTFLGIPTELPNQDSTLLHVAYTKSKQMSNLWSNQKWTDHLKKFGIEKKTGFLFLLT